MTRQNALFPSLVLALAAALGTPANAEIWPGTDPVPGGAIAAKVIGEKCPGVLTDGGLAEIKAYIDWTAAKFRAGTAEEKAYPERFYPAIEIDYAEKYAIASNCTPGSRELARDMLERVRKFMSSK